MVLRAILSPRNPIQRPLVALLLLNVQIIRDKLSNHFFFRKITIQSQNYFFVIPVKTKISKNIKKTEILKNEFGAARSEQE